MSKKNDPRKVDRKIADMFDRHRGKKRGNNRKETLWDLDRDGITFSMLSKWLNCRERFRLSAVEGWTPKGIKVPLEFGSAFHKCMEHVESGGAIEKIAVVTSEYQRGRRSDKKNPIAPQDMDDLAKVMTMVERTFYQYHEYWDQTPTFIGEKRKYYDRHFKYHYQEEAFDVMHTLPNGRKIRLRGRWDAVLFHPVTRKLCLQENKTKSQIDEYAILHGLKKDLQTQFYLWALYLSEGSFPGHILYNVIRRSGMRPRQHEKTNDFADRVEEDIQKRPDHYFMRWVIDVTKDDILSFRRKMLDPILVNVAEWWDSIRRDPFDPWTLEDGSVNRLHFERPFGIYDSAQYGGGKGDFFEILYNDSYNGFVQRDTPFPELEDDE